jgi:protein-serine/threonine kinase
MLSNLYVSSHPSPYLPKFAPSQSPFEINDEPPTTTLRGGTLLHQGFYDLLSMIPTPSPSRFPLFSWRQPEQPVVAGPRYEDLLPVNVGIDTIVPSGSFPVSPAILKKSKRISKDMVSKPTGFMCADSAKSFTCR